MQTPVGQRCTRGYLRDRPRASPLPLAIASRNRAHRLVKLKQTTVKLSAVIQKQLTGARAFPRGAVWRITYPTVPIPPRVIATLIGRPEILGWQPEMPPHPNSKPSCTQIPVPVVRSTAASNVSNSALASRNSETRALSSTQSVSQHFPICHQSNSGRSNRLSE